MSAIALFAAGGVRADYDPNDVHAGAPVASVGDGTVTVIGNEIRDDAGLGASLGENDAGGQNDTGPVPSAGETFVPDPTPPKFTVEEFQQCMDGRNDARTCFRGIQAPSAPAPEAETTDSPTAPGRTITISDVARFVPTNATVAGEPDNVAVVGLPANFLSSAASETLPGTILGRALSIRFTPVNYAFDYGDGERRDSASPGAAWGMSGLAQFSPTDTSHIYKEPGNYTATVTVSYTADIDIGTGWIPIDGTVDGPPATQQIRVVKAYTALVQGTCTERPDAPGC